MNDRVKTQAEPAQAEPAQAESSVDSKKWNKAVALARWPRGG